MIKYQPKAENILVDLHSNKNVLFCDNCKNSPGSSNVAKDGDETLNESIEVY
jgi:prepilin-type processing-associated H-X9-DG protein